MSVTPKAKYSGTEIMRLDPEIKEKLYSYTEDDMNEAEQSIIDRLFNDFIDFDALQEAVRQTHVTGFTTLEYIQKTAMNIRRVDIPIRDFARTTRLPNESISSLSTFRYICYTDIDLVDGDKEYLFRSKVNLYNKDITIQDISDNRSIFKNNIIPIINNKLYWNVQVVVNDDNCGIILYIDYSNSNYKNGITIDEYNQLCEDNAVVTIYSVPNFYIETIKTTISDLGSNIKANSIQFNSTQFNDFSKLDPYSTLFFINSNPNNELLSIVESTSHSNYIEIPKAVMDNNTIPSYIVLTVIKFSKLDSIRVIDLNDRDNGWFVLKNYELPIPTSNIIPLLKNNSRFEIDTEITIDLYYPNIYHVNNRTNKNIRLLIFYDTTGYDSAYENYIKIFYNYYDKFLNIYKTTSLPDIIKNYRPVNIPMMNEFVFNEECVYFPDNKNIFTVDVFQEYIKQNPKLFLKYLYLKLNATDKYFIKVSKLNLEKRLRTSSINDIDEIGDLLYFDEPRYVINLRKKFVGSEMADFKVFVDGIALDISQVCYTYNKDFFLIYIDASIIKPTSMIEIERYINQLKRLNNLYIIEAINDVHNNVTEVFPYIETVPVRIDLRDQFLKKYDIYNVTFLLDDKIVQKNDIYIFVYNEIVDQFIEINKNGHYVISSPFFVAFKADSIGKKLSVIYDSSLVTSQKYINSDESAVAQTNFTTMRETHYNDIRVFRNGLLIPKEIVTYDIYYSNRTCIDMYMNSLMYDNGYLMCDSYPIEFKVEYSTKEIENTKGYINTENSLSYPLDFKWYDIYVNGVKLNKDHVEIISSNKFIIKDVDSLKNLYVIKRSGINDAFTMQHETDSVNVYIDNANKFLDILLEDKDIIQDTADDIIKDVQNIIFEHVLFVKNFLEFSHINPNIQQLSPSVKALYPDLFDEYNILTLQTSENHDAGYITSIDSNIRREYMKRDQYRYSFTPLYVGNHSDALDGEYMCDQVTGLPAIKMESGDILSSGLLSRLSNHKDRLNLKLVNNALTYLEIYQLDRNHNTMSLDLSTNENILDDIVDLNSGNQKFMISFDMDILEKGEDNVLMLSEYDPTIELVYSATDSGENVSIQKTLSQFNEAPIIVNTTDMTLKSIKILPSSYAPSYVKYILYSILIAC